MDATLKRKLQRLADELADKTGDDEWSTVDLTNLGFDPERSIEENADALLEQSMEPHHIGQREASPKRGKKPRPKKSKKQLDGELIDHACDQLSRAGQRYFESGFTAASAAERAIRETKTLFPSDWKLAVQGDNRDAYVEVWEVDHKRSSPCAHIGDRET